jgi:hypothetical protein
VPPMTPEPDARADRTDLEETATRQGVEA